MDWWIGVVTGFVLVVGFLGVLAILAVTGIVLAEFVAKKLKAYTVLWQFAYFYYLGKDEKSLLREVAVLRAELERLRKLKG